MSEDFAMPGFWWRPNSPGRKVFGILDQKVGGKAMLTTYSEVENQWDSGFRNGETIYGDDRDHRPVTLLLVSSTSGARSRGLWTSKFEAGYVVRGVHANDRESLKAESLTLEIQQLYGWLGLSGFVKESGQGCSHDFAIKHDCGTPLTYMLESGIGVTFNLSPLYRARLQEEIIREDVSVSFVRAHGFSWHECFKLNNALAMLLQFANPKPIYPVRMILNRVEVTNCLSAGVVDRAEVSASHFQPPETDHPAHVRWVFRFDDLKANFGKFFADWLSYTEKYAEALKCYTTTVYHSLPSQVTHLCLTQALDAYHGYKLESHGDHDFEKKVRELCEAQSGVLGGIIDDFGEFAKSVKVTRNYLTHHNPKWLEEQEVALGNAELVRLNEKLKILFQACVLSDMGIPAASIGRLRHQIAAELIEF